MFINKNTTISVPFKTILNEINTNADTYSSFSSISFSKKKTLNKRTICIQ